jgi:hypothetical protein
MTNNNVQTAWEILNAALYDLTEGFPEDGIAALEEAITLLGRELEKESVARCNT